MTSTETAETHLDPAHLGTITVIAWAGENVEDGRDMPFLLAYSLGDGAAGPEAGQQALHQLLATSGLPVGGRMLNGARASVPVSVLVEAGSASLTMAHLSAQCLVPEEWSQAAQKRGQVHFMFTTRPWPQGAPGVVVSEEDLKSFVGDEDTITAAAHCLVPVSSLRK
ncbi:DUF5949 family protein [Streptomyces sp. 21So2-11]|uniref:DUF5949 family protein n=1 Tax=Streptomyces sp. 21So2-11 TaxID=3144408 RepID=UPI00321A6C7F